MKFATFESRDRCMGVYCTVCFLIFCMFENFQNWNTGKRFRGASVFTQQQESGRGTLGPRRQPVVVPGLSSLATCKALGSPSAISIKCNDQWLVWCPRGEIDVWKRHYLCVYQSLSRVQLFATPRTVASQAPLSMGFSRQEYWSGLPFPSPEDLPDPGIKPRSPAL